VEALQAEFYVLTGIAGLGSVDKDKVGMAFVLTKWDGSCETRIREDWR